MLFTDMKAKTLYTNRSLAGCEGLEMGDGDKFFIKTVEGVLEIDHQDFWLVLNNIDNSDELRYFNNKHNIMVIISDSIL